MEKRRGEKGEATELRQNNIGEQGFFLYIARTK